LGLLLFLVDLFLVDTDPAWTGTVGLCLDEAREIDVQIDRAASLHNAVLAPAPANSKASLRLGGLVR
jgi:hypothetical protein